MILMPGQTWPSDSGIEALRRATSRSELFWSRLAGFGGVGHVWTKYERNGMPLNGQISYDGWGGVTLPPANAGQYFTVINISNDMPARVSGPFGCIGLPPGHRLTYPKRKAVAERLSGKTLEGVQ